MAAIELGSTPLVSDANLRAYWKLEDVNDSTANGYNLTNNGSLSFGAALFNNGADLGNPNTTKFLSTTNVFGISTGSRTLSFGGWFKLNAEISTSQFDMAAKRIDIDGTNRGVYYLVYEYNAGTRRFNVGYYDGTNNNAYYDVTLGTTWHHIFITSDNTGWIFYLDGVSRITGTTAATSTWAVDTSFWLGYGGSAAYWTPGIYDDWSFFSRKLADTEVSNLYNGTWPIIGRSHMTPNTSFWGA